MSSHYILSLIGVRRKTPLELSEQAGRLADWMNCHFDAAATVAQASVLPLLGSMMIAAALDDIAEVQDVFATDEPLGEQIYVPAAAIEDDYLGEFMEVPKISAEAPAVLETFKPGALERAARLTP